MSALAALAAILVAVAGGAVAHGGNGQAVRFAHVDPSLYASDGPAGKFTPQSLSSKPVAAIVQLGGAPVAVRDAAAKQQGQKLTAGQKAAIRQELKSKQDALHGSLANAGAKIVGQMQDAYNGIQVVVPQKNVPQLAALSGVTAVHAVPKFKPALVHGVPFIGAPTAWQNTGATGAGVKVGIIDTGVDYTHADFGGEGTVAGWDYAFAHSTDDPASDPRLAAEFGPSAPKVKGGWDFVGDDYNADDPAHSTPQPDPNPLDCFNHGTHTAGILGGLGVLADGSTYTGPYNASTIDSHSWNVGPGVAPGADIYEYRTFGCGGSSQIVDLAINKAVADGMNVISMSLGSDFGGMDDPTSVAAQNAVEDGISVVASAGNAGPSGYMVGSPSTANGVLSVAAMDGTTPTFPGAHLALSTGKALDTINANGATFTDGTTLPVAVVRDASKPGGIGLGCSTAEFQAANVAGKLAVVQRGTCARVAKAIFGSDAGAAAVVMINNAAGYPPFEGDITSNPDTGEPHAKITIPFLGVNGDVTSDDAVNLIAADGGTVTLTNNTVDNPGYKTTTSFSSAGPRSPDSAPKPDVIAPGLSVLSAGIGTGNLPLVDSGTSMACPMAAGVAALVKQVHPTWDGLQIKAAIMNTADKSLNSGYNPRKAGAGVVQAQRAVNSSVLATTANQLDSLAFGYVPASDAYSDSKVFTLTNTGDSAALYHLSVAGSGDDLGTSVTITSPTDVTVPAHGTASVQVNLSISAAAVAALPSADASNFGSIVTVRGDIVATPDASDAASAQPLAVPYMVVPRGLSNVTAGTPGAFAKPHPPVEGLGDLFTSSLPVSNNGIHDGTADLYTWGIHDANESGGPTDVRDVGVQSLPGAALGGSDSDRSLVFIINTYGRTSNQAANEYDVLLDTNRDGAADYAVFGADFGKVTTGDNDGRFAAFTYNIATGEIVDIWVATAPMNGSTVELPALASEVGLVPKNSGTKPVEQFAYAVDAFDNVNGGVDSTGAALFNAFNPAVSSGDFASLAPGDSASLSLAVNRPELKKQKPLGWLVASLDDANGAAQAAEVPVPNDKNLH